MRKEHKQKEKMGKETIRYWKSAYDKIVVNYSGIRTIKTNICKLIDIVGLALVLFFQDRNNASYCNKPGPGAA